MCDTIEVKQAPPQYDERKKERNNLYKTERRETEQQQTFGANIFLCDRWTVKTRLTVLYYFNVQISCILIWISFVVRWRVFLFSFFAFAFALIKLEFVVEMSAMRESRKSTIVMRLTVIMNWRSEETVVFFTVNCGSSVWHFQWVLADYRHFHCILGDRRHFQCVLGNHRDFRCVLDDHRHFQCF